MIRVLIIENDQPVQQAIKHTFQQIASVDYQIEWQNALFLKSLTRTDFDILILATPIDWQTAHQQLHQVLKLELSQPVVLLTTNYDVEFEQQAIAQGADDCISISEITPVFLNHAIRHAIQRKATEAKMAHIATHDRLTGMANRYLLYQYLEHAINLAKRSASQFAVLFIDLDKFKFINDSLGHEIGDMLLKLVSQKLKACVRETDIVARFGNDEFAILLENGGTCRNVALVAEKIQDALQPAIKIREHELFITTSIGIASFPECGIEPESLMKSAEMALHKAKETGRNQYHFFTQELNKQARLKLELERNLRRALINREFEIHLQPQIFSKTNSIAGAEALLRWNHPKYGFISPEIFIPLLDELGLLVGVEAWVLNSVCSLAKKLTDQYGRLRFSVNISGSHFKTGNLKENIYLALQASSLEANFLEVELTEDIMIEHVEHNSEMLKELKDIGVSIALDDFGKGYSSLSYLKNFPADILKIDKAFIDQLVNDQRNSAIVEAMIDLSHKLGIKVVAEGVEVASQLKHLKTIGCDYIQGYYFAKPMPIGDFENFLSHSDKLLRVINNELN
ncbi:putative bifunctional diguanylate cyclase/phosphodiesterase [Aliikangiella maris]|uniref:EAL domain-containing protein n=2 Tax=Aliikangiella maris TaxID=3162458 RepID=A0ABV2BSV2_9GAMM